MASRVTGSPLAFLNRTEYYFDPKTGDRYRFTFLGPKAPILNIYLGYKNAGCKVTSTHRGPLWECTAEIGLDPTQVISEQPVEQWNIDMEPVQVSIWSHPSVDAELALYTNPALFRKDIEDAVKNGTGLITEQASNPVAIWLYRLLVRGTEAYEIKRPIISRVRTFSLNYASRITLDQTENVYTTTALRTHFNVPPIIYAQLPANPASVPSGCAWSWKVRTDRSEIIPALSKIQETKDWVFAAWSTNLYTLVSS